MVKWFCIESEIFRVSFC